MSSNQLLANGDEYTEDPDVAQTMALIFQQPPTRPAPPRTEGGLFAIHRRHYSLSNMQKHFVIAELLVDWSRFLEHVSDHTLRMVLPGLTHEDIIARILPDATRRRPILLSDGAATLEDLGLPEDQTEETGWLDMNNHQKLGILVAAFGNPEPESSCQECENGSRKFWFCCVIWDMNRNRDICGGCIFDSAQVHCDASA